VANNKRGLFVIRYQELGTGRDGGLGPVKSLKKTLNSPKDAKKKLRAHAVIVSVRKASSGNL
jgi:hypothetical protein